MRSRFAARLLAQAGFTRVYELAHGMAGWTGDREYDEAPLFGPSPWLIENADLLPQGGRALDVACGAGRHALLLAAAGFDVTAIDRDTAALDRLRLHSERLGLQLKTEVIDLEPTTARGGASAEVLAPGRLRSNPRHALPPPPALPAPDPVARPRRHADLRNLPRTTSRTRPPEESRVPVEARRVVHPRRPPHDPPPPRRRLRRRHALLDRRPPDEVNRSRTRATLRRSLDRSFDPRSIASQPFFDRSN